MASGCWSACQQWSVWLLKKVTWHSTLNLDLSTAHTLVTLRKDGAGNLEMVSFYGVNRFISKCYLGFRFSFPLICMQVGKKGLQDLQVMSAEHKGN